MGAEKSTKSNPTHHDKNWSAGDLVMAFAFIVFAVLMFLGAYHFPWHPRMKIITSAGFVPMLLSLVIILLSIILIVSILLKYGSVSITDWFRSTIADDRIRRSFTIGGITFVYILAIGHLNFIIINTLYLIVMFRYLNVGNWIRITLYAVLSGIFIGVLVPFIFQMPIP